MRRLLVRHFPLAPVARLVPVVWVLGLTALGGVGLRSLRWSLPPLSLAPPQPPQPPQPPAALSRPLEHQQPASAAPAPRHVTRSLSELGLSGSPAARGPSDYALLLTRVPRAGSELLSLLLRRMQPANGFRLLHLPLPSPGHPGRWLSATEQEELVVQVTDTLRREAVPVAFHGAVPFTNFSTFDRQSPTYVSLLRDPVERAVAGLHRAPSGPSGTTPPPHARRSEAVDGNLLRPDVVDGDPVDVLERCLRSPSSRPECAWAEPQSPFFCGHDGRCRSVNGDWALKQAMANIDQYFPVVGILEELNATLAVLETRLPLFFAGVRDVYRHQLRAPHTNWDRSKVLNLKPEVREKFEKRLALEHELYVWAKQRLMLQHFEDSQKQPRPGEAGQDRLVQSVHQKVSSEQNQE